MFGCVAVLGCVRLSSVGWSGSETAAISRERPTDFRTTGYSDPSLADILIRDGRVFVTGVRPSWPLTRQSRLAAAAAAGFPPPFVAEGFLPMPSVPDGKSARRPQNRPGSRSQIEAESVRTPTGRLRFRRSQGEKPRRKKRGGALQRVVESKAISRLGIDQYKEKIQSHYDGPAGAVLAIGSMLSLHEPLVGRMIQRGDFDVTRFDSILDIGSGAGQIMGHLVKAVRPDTRLTGIDLSPGMLARAERRVDDDRPAYVAADMTNLPFEDDTFDCVTCGFVIEHLPDPTPGLVEMHRVLRPGGRLLLLATEDTYLGAWVSRTWDCRTYNREELADACEAAGLPWERELWFTAVHERLGMGGIAFEAKKV